MLCQKTGPTIAGLWWRTWGRAGYAVLGRAGSAGGRGERLEKEFISMGG